MAPAYSSVLICFAVREEAQCFARPLLKSTSIDVLITGMGSQNATRAIHRALTERHPDLVLSCGFAGALRPGLAIGSLLYSAEGLEALRPVFSALRAEPARFHFAARIVTTAAEKHALWQSTRADAVEMESEAIRKVCRERKVPSATFRVISDSADRDLPLDFNALMNERQELSYWKLAWALAQAPGKVAGLLRLQREAKLAARKLADALVELLGRNESSWR